MSLGSIISMVFTIGLVVGGFVYFLNLAIQKEKQKK